MPPEGFHLPARLSIKVAGAELSQGVMDALVDAHITRSVGVPAYCRLVFRAETTGSGTDAGGFTAKIGDKTEIKVIDDTEFTVFDGMIVSKGLELDSGTSQYLVYECYDRLYQLGRETKTRTFVKQTSSDIIKQVIGEVGLSPGEIPATSYTHPTVYQFGTTYAFLDRLIRDIGCEWFCVGEKLHVRPRQRNQAEQSATLRVGENLRSFQARYSPAEHVKEVKVAGWDPVRKEPIVGSAKFETTYVGAGISLNTKTQSEVHGKSVLSIPRAVGDKSEADGLAKAIMERRGSEMIRARGEALVCDIKPGTKVKIEGLVDEWAGEYYCTAVEHHLGPGGSMRTFFDVGPSDAESLVDIFDGRSDTTLDRVVGSLTIGIVTNINDPDNFNRVKVKLPYFTEAEETNWARVLQIGAGGERGWVTLPEVNDEVLVGFEHGSLDRPFVLGGLHNGKDKAKHAQQDLVKDGAVQSRVFNSRLGHELQFMDGGKDTEQFVHIKTAKGKAILRLGEDKIDLQATDIPVKVFNKEGMFEITKTGAITIQGDSITLKAEKDIKIEAGMNLKATAGVQLDMEGEMISVKAKSVGTFDGGKSAFVKGQIVMIN